MGSYRAPQKRKMETMIPKAIEESENGDNDCTNDECTLKKARLEEKKQQIFYERKKQNILSFLLLVLQRSIEIVYISQSAHFPFQFKMYHHLERLAAFDKILWISIGGKFYKELMI